MDGRTTEARDEAPSLLAENDLHLAPELVEVLGSDGDVQELLEQGFLRDFAEGSDQITGYQLEPGSEGGDHCLS